VSDRIDRATFLAENRIAVLSTELEDGGSYQAAVWFEYVDGAFLIPTGGESRKARNARARPRGAILVDERTGRFRGLGARGRLEVITGEAALAHNARIYRRYVTEAGMAHPGVGGQLADDTVTLRLVAERWHEWDLFPAFGTRLEDPALAHPLTR
jgi:hypothetical protein